MQEDYSFLLDPAYFPSSPIEMPLIPNQFVEMSNVSACFSHGCTPDAIPELSTDAKDKIQMQSHSSAVVGHHVDDKGINLRKKRKQKRPIDGEETPKGYVHLRTRRGQATDSHSLAERVRREKISVRMKILQGLVPGCDKVVGRALILDEIINYIKYMRNQVEFLSMKLATMNTVFNDFRVNSDYCMNQTERLGMMSQQLPFEHQISFHQTTAFDLDNFSMMNSSSTLPAKRQRTTVFTQDNEAFLMQVGEHSEGFLKQVELDNIYFQ